MNDVVYGIALQWDTRYSSIVPKLVKGNVLNIIYDHATGFKYQVLTTDNEEVEILENFISTTPSGVRNQIWFEQYEEVPTVYQATVMPSVELNPSYNTIPATEVTGSGSANMLRAYDPSTSTHFVEGNDEMVLSFFDIWKMLHEGNEDHLSSSVEKSINGSQKGKRKGSV